MFLEGRNNRLEVFEVQPDDEVVDSNFEAKGICAFEWEMLINMVQLYFIFGNRQVEDVRFFWSIIIFRDVIINQSVLFMIHVFLDKLSS